MLNKLEIENKLSQVAKGKLDLWDFHRWLQDSSWNMHKESSESAMALVEDIKLSFEEYYQGKLDENRLLECLMSIPIVYVRPAQASVAVEMLPYSRLRLAGSPREPAFA